MTPAKASHTSYDLDTIHAVARRLVGLLDDREPRLGAWSCALGIELGRMEACVTPGERHSELAALFEHLSHPGAQTSAPWPVPGADPANVPKRGPNRTYVLYLAGGRWPGRLVELTRVGERYAVCASNGCDFDNEARIGLRTTMGALPIHESHAAAVAEAEDCVRQWQEKGAWLARIELSDPPDRSPLQSGGDGSIYLYTGGPVSVGDAGDAALSLSTGPVGPASVGEPGEVGVPPQAGKAK